MKCQVRDVSVHYEVRGNGRPLLMLHGNPTDHRSMRGAFEPIFAKRDGWQRLYLDLPGMGLTPGAGWIRGTDEMLLVNDLEAPFAKPVLIITGRHDNITGYRDAQPFLEQCPRATYAVLDRAGHAVNIEQEGLFNALVEEWLDRVEEYVEATAVPRNDTHQYI